MDLKKVLSFPPYPGDYLHPVVYACTAVMLLCLLVSIMTYIIHHRVVRISRNGWHTLVNFLFHTGMTFGIFAGGVNQIDFPFVCQIVGVGIHYASLSTMLWLTFMARNLCKDVCKDPMQSHDNCGPGQTRRKPTIFRFYLVSNGVPLIIVGVTAAFGLDNYGSRSEALYCWMAWEPSLGGFYAPVSLLIVIMCVYFLCTYIQLKRHRERKYELRILTEEQQQLSSSEPGQPYHIDTGGPSATDCPHFGVSVLGNEHSFKSQLRATAFTLFLFLSTWALGALAVSLGHFLDMIFSCLYGAFCVTLGLFLLIQHCAKRDDVWHRWWACCPSRSKKGDANENGHGQRQELHQPHCHLNSPCAGKPLLLSPQIGQKIATSSQTLTPSHAGPCCVAVMSPVATSPISPLTESMPSPHIQLLPNDLPRPTLPLQSCLIDRTKSRSFNRPRPCLQDYRSHLASTSMDSSRLDSPSAAHYYEGIPMISNSPHPDLQIPCPSPHLEKQLPSCHSLQRQTSCHSVQDSLASCHSLLMPSHGVRSCQWPMYSSVDHSSNLSCSEKPDPYNLQYQSDVESYNCMTKTLRREKDTLTVEPDQKCFPRNTLPRQHATINRRATIGRNRSLQDEGLFGSDTTVNVRTGPWKNETSV